MATSNQSSNQTGNDNESWWEPRTLGVNTIISSLMVFIILVALVGNILVIMAVFLYHRLKEEVSNLFIVNLSITDLSSATVIMISSVIAVSADSWVLGSVWCSLVCGANYCFIIVSMLTLCLISLDRYVAINHSLRYHSHVTKPRVLILIGYTWLQGFVFGLTPILYDWIDYDYWEAICAIQWYRYGVPVLIYVIVAFILCFLLPGVILIVAYCKVFKTAKKIKSHSQPVIQMVSLDLEQREMRESHSRSAGICTRQLMPKYSESSKAICSLLIVVLAFFICMTPFSVTKLYKVCVPVPDALPGYANMVATFFQYMSSAVNPLIYGLFRRDFRKAFLYLLQRMFHNRKPTGTSSCVI